MKSWKTYLSKKENGLHEHKDMLLIAIKEIAMSSSEEEYKINAASLKK